MEKNTLQKLAYIYPLRDSLNLNDDNLKIQIVKLIHSLAVGGTSRKLSVEETLASLNILSSSPSGMDDSLEAADPFFLDNPKIPSYFGIYFR